MSTISCENCGAYEPNTLGGGTFHCNILHRYIGYSMRSMLATVCKHYPVVRPPEVDADINEKPMETKEPDERMFEKAARKVLSDGYSRASKEYGEFIMSGPWQEVCKAQVVGIEIIKQTYLAAVGQVNQWNDTCSTRPAGLGEFLEQMKASAKEPSNDC